MEKVSGSLPPREKLQQQGASALSDAELLAIFLRTGASGVPVLMLAQRMLNEFGSLYNIMTAGQADFSHIKGVGEAKLAQLHAIAELGKRYFSTQLLSENVLENPQATYHYLQSVLAHQEREIFMAIFLDNQHRVLQFAELFFGTLDAASVYPREVVQTVLKYNAAAVILCHNHPSGVAEPSRADRSLTDRICAALGLIDVRVLDHLVIGDGETVSFAERGWL